MEAALATPAGEVGRLVGELRRVADELLAVSGSSRSADAVQVAAGLVAVSEAAHVVEAARLGLVRALGAVDVREAGATSVAALLGWRCRTAPGRARADVAAARAVDPDAAAADAANGGTCRGEAGALAGMGAALAQGRVSRAHLDVAVRVLEKVPMRMRSAAAATVDEFLVEVSQKYPPRECEHLAAELLDRLDPDRSERGFDPDAFARRRFDLVADSTGMLVVRGQLDPMTGARLKAAVESLAAPDPAAEVVTDDGGTLVVRDERTPSQRRADAIGLLASRATAAPGSSTAGAGGDAARVVVHATLDQVTALGSADPRQRGDAGRAWCEQTGFVPTDVLERLTCSAVFQRVLLAPDGGVLNLGRSARLASPAQRRARWRHGTGAASRPAAPGRRTRRTPTT